ncbi:MAG: hypothetical protein ACI9D5_002736 [Candidatus Endobugula sp.]|jgi:hypothetical protein
MKIAGECFCGKVSYTVDGPLRDARYVIALVTEKPLVHKHRPKL